MNKRADKPCVICKKPQSNDWRPFCSKRCADIDLGRWLSGHYVIGDSSGGAEHEDRAAGMPDGGSKSNGSR